MDASEELVTRCAERRRAKLGDLSDEGYAELVRAVRENPAGFVDDSSDQAFAKVAEALAQLDGAGSDDDLLDDDEYLRVRRRRLDRLAQSCTEALSIDENCLDARLLSVLAADETPDITLGRLLDLTHELDEQTPVVPDEGQTDAWNDVLARPRLRLDAAVARTCLETARHRMAISTCESLLSRSPADQLGARFTLALALARLEDADAFEELDVRFGRTGNAWFHLARTLLLYKLERESAARRALHGFDQLCEGGAYVLLRPAYVDTYLPDRPIFSAGSFEEATMAVHEADPIIVDVPDFVSWASAQPGIEESARGFAEEQGYDW